MEPMGARVARCNTQFWALSQHDRRAKYAILNIRRTQEKIQACTPARPHSGHLFGRLGGRPQNLLALPEHVEVQLRQAWHIAGDGDPAEHVVVEREIKAVGHAETERPLLADDWHG